MEHGTEEFIYRAPSCLENPRDGRAWWAAVHGVAQSWTGLKRLGSSSSNGEIDIENRLMVMGRGEERVRCMERVKWKLPLLYVK